MNNKHDEIKNLIKASRNMLSNSNTINEINEIKNKYNLISEQVDLNRFDNNSFKRIDVGNSIESSMSRGSDSQIPKRGSVDDSPKSSKRDKTTTYRISGGILKISGKTTKELQLTEDEKITFQETMDEFIDEVANLVDFDELHIYQNDVTWSGKLNDFDLLFNFRIGEENGVYVKVDNLSKLSNEIIEVMEKLKKYYNKFKSKWAEILGNRKKTKTE
jgi:hypothetical protein